MTYRKYAPTCADDQLLIADDAATLQAMLNLCSDYMENQLYTINPQKSKIVHHVQSIRSKKLNYQPEWHIGQQDASEQVSRMTSLTLGLIGVLIRYHLT